MTSGHPLNTAPINKQQKDGARGRAVIEALVDVWIKAMANGEGIEIEHFMVLEMQVIERYRNNPFLRKTFRQIKLRASKTLRDKLNI
jgi:nucleoid DNA-binding protein